MNLYFVLAIIAFVVFVAILTIMCIDEKKLYRFPTWTVAATLLGSPCAVVICLALGCAMR